MEKSRVKLVIFSPGGKKENAYTEPKNGDKYAKLMYEITTTNLKLTHNDEAQGKHHIIIENDFDTAKNEMWNIYEETNKVNDEKDPIILIVLVLSDGFYSRIGDAIWFHDGPELIDSFFKPIYEDANREIKFCVMSFNSRLFVPDEDKDYEKFFSKEREKEATYRLKHVIESPPSGDSKFIHGKRNTMKIFHCRRGEKYSRTRNTAQRIENYCDFIIEMNKAREERNFEKILFQDDFHFIHSLSDNILNQLNSKVLDGKPLFASMVIEVEDDTIEPGENYKPFTDGDEKKFSETIKEFFDDPDIMQIRDATDDFGDPILDKIPNYETYNAISKYNAVKFFEKIRAEMLKKKPSVVVIYISGHGTYEKGGKHICFSNLSEKPEAETSISLENLVKTLYEGFIQPAQSIELRKIPKIIINDNCHGKARFYQDMIIKQRTTQSEKEKMSNQYHNKGPPAASGTIRRGQGPKNPWTKKTNTIVFNASVEQNYSFGNSMFKAIASCLETHSDPVLNIMDFSFRVVRHFEDMENETYAKILTADEAKLGYDGYYWSSEKNMYIYYKNEFFPYMCQIDVDLQSNFSLQIKPKLKKDPKMLEFS